MSFIYLLRKTINITSPGICKLHLLQPREFLILSTRYICCKAKERPFTVTYLVNKCGLSPESALSASRYVNFETPDKADSVLALFENHGFSKTQVGILVKGFPQVLLSDPVKTLLPKLDFFRSKCVSTTDLAKIFCYNPALLRRSLQKHIIPSFDILKELLKSEEKTIASIKRFGKILLMDFDSTLVPNINVLRENGVPESKIITLIQYQPRSIAVKTHLFREIVEEVKKMGFNPLRLKFVLAVYAFRTMRRSTWDNKVSVYRKWGWSEKEIIEAFKRHPWCMMVSEKKIMGVMDFLVKDLGIDSSEIVRRPSLISLSLEKRIVPRGLVAQVLLSKGLLIEGFSLARFFETTEEVFLESFINCHKDKGDVSQLLKKIYEENLNVSR